MSLSVPQSLSLIVSQCLSSVSLNFSHSVSQYLSLNAGHRHWQQVRKTLTKRSKQIGNSSASTPLVIFNTGAHWTKTPAQAGLLFRLIARAMQRVFAEPGAVIVFRTNIMGHDNCHRFSKPSTATSRSFSLSLSSVLKSETPDCQYSIYPCLESAGISNTAP